MNLRTFHITVQWLIKPSGPQKTVTPVTFSIAMIIMACQSLYKDLGINCNTQLFSYFWYKKYALTLQYTKSPKI